jgi:LysM repeat protein
MTVTDPEPHTLPLPGVDDPVAGPPLTRICPYLAAAGGAWRSASAEREHRCGAVTPPAILAAEKQRRLCLTADFATCATFEAARAARPVARVRAPTLPRPLARTTPLVLDRGRMAVAVPALNPDRSNGQAVLIALLALAFAAIVLARLTGGSAPAPAVVSGASPSPHVPARADTGSSLAATGQQKPVPTSVPSPSVAPTPGSSSSAAQATPPPPAAPATKATRTYKVKAGDTLIAIAAKFGTKQQAIKKLNGITDPSTLKIGQVLKIP